MQLINTLREDRLVETLELQFLRERQTYVSSMEQLNRRCKEIDCIFNMGKYERALELASHG